MASNPLITKLADVLVLKRPRPSCTGLGELSLTVSEVLFFDGDVFQALLTGGVDKTCAMAFSGGGEIVSGLLTAGSDDFQYAYQRQLITDGEIIAGQLTEADSEGGWSTTYYLVMYGDGELVESFSPEQFFGLDFSSENNTVYLVVTL